MSDLTGAGTARAANGGARAAAGPVAVTQSERTNIRTPQMIMSARNEREATRRKQAEAEEQRKAEDERRRSAERRAHAAGVAGAPPTSEPASQRVAAQSAPLRSGEYSSPGGGGARQQDRVVPSSAGLDTPPGPNQAHDATAGAQYARPRGSSQAQQPQPRPVPAYEPTHAPAPDSRRPPPMQQPRRPAAQAGPSQAGPSTAAPQSQPSGAQSGSQQRQSTSSSFPHAFERWEMLSSHWEGLTSYWIRKLEQNTDEKSLKDPLTLQMSRQITDLSAAGANLFHAVVELQRLRASSERKFQRWFLEHRQEQERAQESQAQMDHMMRAERDERVNAVSNMERMSIEKKNAERMVAEMKRELQISKEEARRAWEELGRREQEERDRTFSLRDGNPTLIGGVQVVPMIQGPGRHASVSQRPHGSDEPYGAGPSGGQGIEHRYSYEEGQSPTDTDPFTEDVRQTTPTQREHVAPPLVQGSYIPTGASAHAASAASASTARPTGFSQPPDQPQVPAPLPPQQPATDAQQAPPPLVTSRPEAFYQQPEVYLHRETATSIPDDERSYVTSHGEDITSEGDEEYAVDDYGNYMLDESGHRVPYRALRENDSDEFDVREDRRRELEHLQRYGTAPQAMSTYATTSSAGPSHQPDQPTSNALPDYSGAGYGSEWAGMRHHHPTRLSDVLEEDERSRTSPSRASQASRGRF